MKNRNHGLSEKELVQLLMADCESIGDIQAKLKKLFAGTIEQMLEVEMALDEIIWLITLLCNQSIEIHNLRNSEKKPLLTEETVELLTSPGELAEYKDAITEAMLKGTKRNVESDDTSKNAVTAACTTQNCSPGCSITERRSCTSVRRRCGLCRAGFCWICGSVISSLLESPNLSGKRILTRLCRWEFDWKSG